MIARASNGIVIVGGGFGGLACAKALGNTGIPVALIDRSNYHLFAPLLYQVATAALSPADIARPIRRILTRFQNIRVIMGEVETVDVEKRRVVLKDADALPFEVLVLATGSQYSYFGHEDWAAVAPGLKGLNDARLIRSRLLEAFEKAELSSDPAEKSALMTTAIVGGGPTGVEMAGSVAELARYAVARDFRRIDPRSARVVLLEAGPRVLPAFPASLSDYAHKALERLGVTVLIGHKVERVEPGAIVANSQRIAASTIVWAAGVEASSAALWLRATRDRLGRLAVNADLSVVGLDGIYVVGDAAACHDRDGNPLPALAQVAAQQGRHLGKALAANWHRGKAMPPFRFRNRGNTAIIGRHAAVFDFGRWQLKGRPAWLLWALVHIYLLVGFDQRLRVSLQWLWRYITYERGARLILP